MIAIIDYDAGNLQSVKKALDFIGCDNMFTSDAGAIHECDGIVLPGVGAFGDAMESLRSKALHRVIENEIAAGKPFLGICLGMQLLFQSSEESPGAVGLGIISGSIRRIPNDSLKVPHIGWNSLEIMKKDGIFENTANGSFVYFVHSYYLTADNENEVAARTDYAVTIDAAVSRDNVYAVQFHPEKSGRVGIEMLRSFGRIVGGGR